MRGWVGVPGPAGLGLERARSKVVSLIAVTSELHGFRLKKDDDLLVFSGRARPGLSLGRIVVPQALSRKLAQAAARAAAWCRGAVSPAARP
jgi:hypothetical protein